MNGIAKCNKVMRIALSGGIIGLLATNPRRAPDHRIDKEHRGSWAVTYFLPHPDTNLFMSVLRLAVLACTAFVWTRSAGYRILFEHETAR